MLIQQNKFYWISDRSMVAHLNYTDTELWLEIWIDVMMVQRFTGQFTDKHTEVEGIDPLPPAPFMYTVLLRVTLTLTLTLTNTSFSLAISWSSVRALLHQTRTMYSRSVQSFQSHHLQCLHFPVIHRSKIRLLVLFHNNNTFVFSKMCWIFSLLDNFGISLV